MSREIKRAFREVKREMKEITELAAERTRDLSDAIAVLRAEGINGVPKVLKTYGKSFTPAEKALLENATDDVIKKLLETRATLQSLRSTIECI